jgi:putative tryptophan/tyrosine transport system substrate-binding protein
MQFDQMKRREFIALVGAAAAAWPLAARAQQPERMRRIGVLMSTAADDPEGRARIAAFLGGLQQLGWTDGRNAQIETRWPKGYEEARKYAAELVALAPDVIVATGVYAGRLLQQETQTVPIVFVLVLDPVGAGFVASLARPRGNATGFSFSEYGVSGKWLELLKELAPSVTRAAVLRDAADPAGTGQWGAIQSVAPSFGVELTPIGVRDPAEIESGVAEFVRSPNGGLIVTAGGPVIVHREQIIATAARHRLPTVYWNRMYVAGGGLMSYGPETIDQYRRAAGYVDRILKGEKPADLPVQTPVKYELVINLKAAKALGLTVPDKLLARADEVIE